MTSSQPGMIHHAVKAAAATTFAVWALSLLAASATRQPVWFFYGALPSTIALVILGIFYVNTRPQPQQETAGQEISRLIHEIAVRKARLDQLRQRGASVLAISAAEQALQDATKALESAQDSRRELTAATV